MKRILIIGPMGSGKSRKIKEMMSSHQNVKYVNPITLSYQTLRSIKNPNWLVFDGDMDLKLLYRSMRLASLFPSINILFAYQGQLKELPIPIKKWSWDEIIDLSNGRTYEKTETFKIEESGADQVI